MELGQLIGDGDKITNEFFLRLHLNFPELFALKSLALKFFHRDILISFRLRGLKHCQLIGGDDLSTW